MKAASANRMTKMKVIEGGQVVKTVANASINYGQDLSQLKKMIEIAIRLSPQDPVYLVEKVTIEIGDGKYSEIDQNELLAVQNSLFKSDPSSASAIGTKVSLKVYVTRPQGSAPRAVSRLRVPEARDENSKYDNIMRPPSPMNMKRPLAASGTPNRAQSRGRTAAAPRAPLPSAGSSAAVPLRSAASPLRPTRPPAPPAAEGVQEVVEMPMPPPSATRTPRRLTQVDLAAADKAQALKMIHTTWTTVCDPVPTDDLLPSTPPKMLAPFDYYSPLEESFTSCAGDMGEDHHLGVIDEDEEVERMQEMETPSKVPFSPSAPSAAPSTSAAASTGPVATPLSPMTPLNKRASVTPHKSSKKAVPKKDIKPVFPEGRTAAESGVTYEHSLRTYGSHVPSKGAAKDRSAKKPTKEIVSPVRGEGRPSIGTITTQWEFMRTAFVNNSDEELEWLMISKRPGAYTYAHKKHTVNEDKYFKCLFEIDLFTQQASFWTSGQGSQLLTACSQLAACYSPLMATPKDEATIAKLREIHGQIVRLVEQIGSSPAISQKIQLPLGTLVSEGDHFRIARKGRDLHPLLVAEVGQMKQKLLQSNKESELALEQMEKWSKRETETDDYAKVLKDQEDEWLAKEKEENELALQTMRAYMPSNLPELSVPELMAAVRAQGGLLSLELATELKTNKLLHWLITHPEDIAASNFLAGDRKAHFENIEVLDIIELRALACVLPERFDLDNDLRKAEWRTRFMGRVKQIVAQARGDMVKGAWDGIKGGRSMVTLAPLKPEQQRRAVYYYRTHAVSQQKLKQYTDKYALLAKKQAALQTAEADAKEAKEEYDTVLRESRDQDFIEQFGSEKLSAAKDLAKKEHAACESKRKHLLAEVSRLQASINALPLSREAFMEHDALLQQFLSERGVDWTDSALTATSSALLIDGWFPEDKVIEKRLTASVAKFLSAEEEAEQRKRELTALSRPAEEVAVSASTSSRCSPSEEMLASAAVCGGVGAVAGAAVTPAPSAVAPALPVTTSVADRIADFKRSSTPLRGCNSSTEGLSTPSRRGSILTSANGEMLVTLNKMFSSLSSPQAPARGATPSRRMSVAPGPLAAPAQGVAEAGPREVKQSKSKLLKRLLGGSSSSSAPVDGTAPKAALSFLDQLKARSGGMGGGGAAAPSFLDQLRSRGRGGEAVDCAPAPRSQSPVPVPAVSAAPKMSFLEQIKARCKE